MYVNTEDEGINSLTHVKYGYYVMVSNAGTTPFMNQVISMSQGYPAQGRWWQSENGYSVFQGCENYHYGLSHTRLDILKIFIVDLNRFPLYQIGSTMQRKVRLNQLIAMLQMMKTACRF